LTGVYTLAYHAKKTDEANRRDAIRERLVKASHLYLLLRNLS